MLNRQRWQVARGFVLCVAVILSDVVFAGRPHSTNRSGAETVSKKSKASANTRKLAKVRDELHHNLDGKAQGFIRGWSFNSKVFTLTVDKSRYQQSAVWAAAITARSIFDINGVPLPKKLVIRDRSGELLGEGPFSNVPKIVE